MKSSPHLPKWIGLGLLLVFLVAGGLGLLRRVKPAAAANLAAVEEAFAPAGVDDGEALVFDPRPEAVPEAETLPLPPEVPPSPAPPPLVQHATPVPVRPPPPLPLPGGDPLTPGPGVLPDLVVEQPVRPAAPEGIPDRPPESPIPAKPQSVKPAAPPPVAKTEKPAAPAPIPPVKPSPAATTPPVLPQDAARVEPKPTTPVKPSLAPRPEPPLAAEPVAATPTPPPPPVAVAPLAVAMTPVKPDTAPARNGATHRSAYLITPAEINRYRRENGVAPVPFAADEQAGLATHAEALGFAGWLTRTHRTAGLLPASESYRLPLGSENKLAQIWSQDSVPQAANETKPFGLVRVAK